MAAAAEPAECCGQHDQSRPAEQLPKPCDRPAKCEGACAFVLPQKVQLDASWSVASPDFVATLPVVAAAQIVWAHASGGGERLHRAAPPLRLHLMHQLLLN